MASNSQCCPQLRSAGDPVARERAARGAGGDGGRHSGAAVRPGERREARGAPRGGEGDQRADGGGVSE